MLRLRTFGGLALENGSARSLTQPRSLALLALAASAGERPISRDKVLAYLWPEVEPAKSGHRLAQLVYSMRNDLGVDSIFRGSNDLRLNPKTITSDVEAFTEALERGDLRGAIDLYQGPFLDGFYLGRSGEFERWAETERAEYHRKYCAALQAGARAEARRGEPAGAAELWRRLSEADPLDAGAAVAYMEALAAAGELARALRFARDYERRLQLEFETEADPAVVSVMERLRNSAAAVSSAVSDPFPAIAVLPFLNLTPERENEYFSDGMTEELVSALARVPGLRVASRTSCFAFKNKDMDAREIAARLGVSALVEGSIRKVGNRIRLNAQLVNAADGCDLWSDSYERTMEHVFTLQEELSQAIVAAMRLVPAKPATPLVRRPTADLDAYTLYLRGRYSVHKRTVEGFTLAIEYLEQAVERDPGFALAHAGLAECWALRGFLEFGDILPDEGMPKARAAALEALRLNPRLPEGHLWLGVVHFLFDWDYETAEAELRRALQLQPEHAFAETWYAVFLGGVGRHEQSIKRIFHALSLEPLSLSIRLCVARCYLFARRYEEALETIDGILRDEPGHQLSIIWATRALLAMGRDADALARIARVPQERQTPYLRSCGASALAGLGRVEEARELCRQLEREFEAGPPFTLFMVGAAQARMGDHDAAITTLERCFRIRDGQVAFLLVQQSYERLRNHPAFERLLDEMRLPAELRPQPAASA